MKKRSAFGKGFPPRRVLIAPDKFKGTLTSNQAARAIARGLRRAWPKVELVRRPIADGGEGFAQSLIRATRGRFFRCLSEDALGRKCTGQWGMLGGARTAVMDLASASGLAQIPAALRDPMTASTFGTGLLMRRAIERGATMLIVGLGGSATSDGGVGIARAFGYRFLDAEGTDIRPGGGALNGLSEVIAPPKLPGVRIVVATDVDNPLYGRNGAAWQFAAQKGADAAAIVELDRGLRRLAAVTQRCLGVGAAREPGAGAAGGCGFGLMTFLNATPRAGFDLLREYIDLDALIRHSDLVVTGEGAFDRTSLAGKGPHRLAQLAHALEVPVWGLFGRIDLAQQRLPFDCSAALSSRGETFDPDADHAATLELAAYRLAARMDG